MLTSIRKGNVAREGSRVVLYEGVDSLYPAVLKRGDVLRCRLGEFPHEDIIGMPFGYRIRSTSRVGGWITLLPLTPELWTRSLRTRTQIVFSADAAFIAQQLELMPGCVMVESGTGSGALTSSFARCVAPSGHVHTFEYNAARVEDAEKDFAINGLAGVVSASHANVYDDGFGAALDDRAHAVFLDLPSPWLAIAHARRALQVGGRIATFSPCMEQVQRTVAELRRSGFHDVRTFECLERKLMTRSAAVPRSDLARLGDHLQGALSAAKSLRKRRSSTRSSMTDAVADAAAVPAPSEGGPAKRARSGEPVAGSDGDPDGDPDSPHDGGEEALLASLVEKRPSKARPTDLLWRTRPVLVMRGHTSYLTFATLRSKDVGAGAGAGAAPAAAAVAPAQGAGASQQSARGEEGGPVPGMPAAGAAADPGPGTAAPPATGE